MNVKSWLDVCWHWACAPWRSPAVDSKRRTGRCRYRNWCRALRDRWNSPCWGIWMQSRHRSPTRACRGEQVEAYAIRYAMMNVRVNELAVFVLKDQAHAQAVMDACRARAEQLPSSLSSICRINMPLHRTR